MSGWFRLCGIKSEIQHPGMKDFFRKTLETVSERINSPMLSSTALAWAAINYKFLLVVLSADDFKRKFAYIDEDLYPSLEAKVRFGVVYPILIGLFYTIAYPVIDIGLVAIREAIDNLKERVIIFIRRKKPIDRDLASEYFSNFDDQIESKQKYLQSILDARDSERKSSLAKIAELKQRLKRQTRLALCGSTYLTPVNVDFPLTQDQGSFSEIWDHKAIADGFKGIRLSRELFAALQVIDSIPFDIYGRRIVGRHHFQSPMGGSDDQVRDDLIEILLALDVLVEIENAVDTFDASNGSERIGRLMSLVAQT